MGHLASRTCPLFKWVVDEAPFSEGLYEHMPESPALQSGPR